MTQKRVKLDGSGHTDDRVLTKGELEVIRKVLKNRMPGVPFYWC